MRAYGGTSRAWFKHTAVFVLGALLVSYQSVDSEDDERVIGRLRRWSSQCGIDLVTELTSLPEWPEGISGHQPSLAELGAYVRLLSSEIDLYPIELLQKTGLRRIVLCRDLIVDLTPRGGLAHKHDGTLFLETVRGASVPIYQMKTIHHELFHMIDIVDAYADGELVYEDREWAALNPDGDKAYQGETDAIRTDDKRWHLSIEWPGFLTHYSSVDVAEDKAEVFANMMTLPSWVNYLGGCDSIVNAKIEYVKRITSELCECVDAAFWDKVSVRREEGGMNRGGDDTRDLLQRKAVEERVGLRPLSEAR